MISTPRNITEVRPGTKPGYMEVIFPWKPAKEETSDLRRAGFRFTCANGPARWYGLVERAPDVYQRAALALEALNATTIPPAWEPDDDHDDHAGDGPNVAPRAIIADHFAPLVWCQACSETGHDAYSRGPCPVHGPGNRARPCGCTPLAPCDETYGNVRSALAPWPCGCDILRTCDAHKETR